MDGVLVCQKNGIEGRFEPLIIAEVRVGRRMEALAVGVHVQLQGFEGRRRVIKFEFGIVGAGAVVEEILRHGGMNGEDVLVDAISGRLAGLGVDSGEEDNVAIGEGELRMVDNEGSLVLLLDNGIIAGDLGGHV